MEPEKKSHGALIGSIIIIIILIIGGIYIWQNKAKEMRLEKEKQQLEMETTVQEDIEGLNTLEEDLNATDINLDLDIENLE